MSGDDKLVQRLSLREAADMLLNECRMVLPGIQALFGFQLVVVFSERFAELPRFDQMLHLVSTTLVTVGIALIMTPAAYHRQAGARHISLRFLRVSTRLMVASMFPLAIAVCLEFYIVADVLWSEGPIAAISLAMFLVYAGLWWMLPRMMLAREHADREAGGKGSDAPAP